MNPFCATEKVVFDRKNGRKGAADVAGAKYSPKNERSSPDNAFGRTGSLDAA